MSFRTFQPLPVGVPRLRWTATLDSLLAAVEKRSKDVVSALTPALQITNPPDLAPWFTHFKQGDPTAMKRIFGDHIDAAKLMPALCKALDLTEAALRSHLEQARNGDFIQPDAPKWHADFPAVGAGEVCATPWVLRHNERRPIALNVFANTIAEALQREHYVSVRLSGQSGSGRHTAARLLCDMVELLVALDDTGVRRNLGQLPAPPLVTRVVDSVTTNKVGARTFTVIVSIDDGDDTYSATVQPWTAAQVTEVAEQLAARTETAPQQADRFREFARAAGNDRELLGSDGRAVAVVGQLAAAGRDGVPQDRRQARMRTVVSAWQRGTTQLRPADPLARVDYTLWTTFWAHRIASTKSPMWTTLSSNEAEVCVRNAAGGLRITRDADLGSLLDTLERSTGKSRQTARAALDRHLAASDPDVLLQRFCQMGLLEAGDGDFRATDTALACAAAATGLAGWRSSQVAQAVAHSELSYRLARELGCLGVTPARFARMLSAWPTQLHLEISRLRVVHAAGLEDTKENTAELPSLVPCWAGTILADSVRALDWRVLVGAGGLRDGRDHMLMAALQDLSVRAAGLWPDLDRGTALETLEKLADPKDLQMVAAWEEVCTAVDAERKHQGDWRLGLATRRTDDEESPGDNQWRQLMFLAPGQTLPWHVEDREQAERVAWRFQDNHAWLDALARRAELPGDRAGPWLAGEHLVFRAESRYGSTTHEFDDETADAVVWRHVPGGLRLRSLAIRARGLPCERMLGLDAVASMTQNTGAGVGPIPAEAWPDWLHLLRRQDPEYVARELTARLIPGARAEWLGGLRVEDAVRIACELQLSAVLVAVSALPEQWMAGARAVLWFGTLRIVGPEGAWRMMRLMDAFPQQSTVGADPSPWAELRKLEALAHLAALEWARHGHPELLRVRWTVGPKWTLPEALRADLNVIRSVLDALAAPLEHMGTVQPNTEVATAWLDGLAAAVASTSTPERLGSTDINRLPPEVTFKQLAELGRDNQTLAAATGAARLPFPTWLSDVMERNTGKSWRQAVFTPAESLSPGQRLGCILLQALALWTRREQVAPILPWIEDMAQAPREPTMWGVGIVVRPYSAAPGLDELAVELRKQAFEALMSLEDPMPVQVWLDEREDWWGDRRAMQRRLQEDSALLTRAFELTEPRTSGRRTVLRLAVARRPPPDWFTAAALADDRDLVASLARDLGRWPQAAALWRHLADTEADPPTRTEHLAALRELEPNCPEWPDHVAHWLEHAELPFAGTGNGQGSWRGGGGFLDLLKSAQELSSRPDIAKAWHAGVLRLLDLWPEAQRTAKEDLRHEKVAPTSEADEEEGISRFNRRSSVWAAENKLRDLETARTLLLRALGGLGELARLDAYVEPMVKELQSGSDGDDVPSDLVLDWVERHKPDVVAGFVADDGPFGAWILHHFDGRYRPRLRRATADLWEARLHAAAAMSESADRYGIETALAWLDHVAPERLPDAVERLLARLPELWTVGVIWGECLHHDDDIGLAIRNRCLSFLAASISTKP